MAQTSLHFGAGALGRGLILPLLADAGVEISVADINSDVVDRIRATGGYPVAIFDRGQRDDVFVPVTRAFAIGRDDAALDAFLTEADFVTTSVQVGNLPNVVHRLTRVWKSSGRARTVVGCENLRKVGRHIKTLFQAANIDLSEQVLAPDCVVDRICSASPSKLLIETERYTEWAVEVPRQFAIKGPTLEEDVDRLFFRKRYLINTLADAVSFLGLRKGHVYLYQAIADEAIIDEVSPLLSLLRRHLVRVFEFGEREITNYQALSLERLGNRSIPRRIETVARDPWRKFGPAERFMEPLLAEANAGDDVTMVLKTMRSIIASVEPDRAIRDMKLAQSWGSSTTNPLFVELVSKSKGLP
jgi:mannitol-1-phosphate 5-dehydrogenase